MPYNWVQKLQANNSRLHKEDVIKQALEASSLGSADAKAFLTLAWYASNPYNTYNTKKVPVIPDLVNRSNPLDTFYTLLHRLQEREITGKAAAAEVERVAYEFDTVLWETLLRPVILKDLRAGATIKTFNKILKGTEFEIPIFEAQLATDSKKQQKKMVGKKFLEPKLDGVRVLATIQGTNVTLYSRNGKVLNNFPHIARQLACSKHLFKTPVFGKDRNNAYVLDGEIISSDFQSLMTQVQRKSDVDTDDAVYNIFDIIPLTDFTRGKWNMPQHQRTNVWLGEMRDKVNAEMPNLNIISGIEVDLDTPEGNCVMERYFHDQVELGLEGIMIKDYNGPYECKRSTSWLKRKPIITVDLNIVGFEEGTGRNTDRLGALLCKGFDEASKKEVEVSVGGGFSDEQRDVFWETRDALLNRIVEVKADVISQNSNGIYSLRFPRFVRFRGFEPGEKL